ncbi:acyl-CoA-binding domain-containing protein 5-like isoform X2 [Durio zibethinus]|uniref:Acyl-CoA-binding domain-containing protein 5-like isoform X2 n=1 Tax=Durio zibethinus TaxID=66656 RepID=A0A6P5YZJ4_DURZI|nr:acyl-CoA-binding domain-containing protein 5-like isoform X2 [Durio zibethinus]
MSWLRMAVNKMMEVGNKNNLTRNIKNYANAVVHHAGYHQRSQTFSRSHSEMGRKGSEWFTTLKKVFKSSSKDLLVKKEVKKDVDISSWPSDLTYEQWVALPVSGARYRHTTAVVDDRLYITGGSCKGRFLYDIQVFAWILIHTY